MVRVAGAANTVPEGSISYAAPTVPAGAFDSSEMVSCVSAESAPAGTRRVARPSLDEMLPPVSPRVADETPPSPPIPPPAPAPTAPAVPPGPTPAPQPHRSLRHHVPRF